MEPRPSLVLRRGTPDDARECHDLLWASATDLGRRRGSPLAGSADDWWRNGEPLNRFLAEHAAEWWLAETDAEGAENPIGYARSIQRGELFELTELFVRPGAQSRGVGRALLERAFPPHRGPVRSIIATTDVRATARYYAAGVVPYFPYFTLAGDARPGGALGDLRAEPIGDAESRSAVTEIERAVLEFPRGADELRWLATNREGTLFRRNRRPAAFAFVSAAGAGPIAALDPEDLPAVIGHVETRASELGTQLELEVPGINVVAVRYLLSRGFRIDPWINLLMSSRPFGHFDRYIGYSPPVFL